MQQHHVHHNYCLLYLRNSCHGTYMSLYSKLNGNGCWKTFETITYLHLMSACKFGDTVHMNTLHIKPCNTPYKACKYRLISTHFSVCNVWLIFRATAIILTASSKVPVKLWVDHQNYLQHQGDHNYL